MAVLIDINDFHRGALRVTSYVRPPKLFTASESIVSSIVGELKMNRFDKILKAVIDILETS